MIKKLIWLIKNKDKLEKLIKSSENNTNNNKGYSIAGVPDFQKERVEELLKDEIK